MPYLEFNLSIELTRKDKHDLCDEIGKLMPLLPGKKRENTMMNIKDDCFMEFGELEDQEEPMANLELRIMGKAPFESKEAFIKAFHEMVEARTGIDPKRVLVNIVEHSSWGVNKEYHIIQNP